MKAWDDSIEWEEEDWRYVYIGRAEAEEGSRPFGKTPFEIEYGITFEEIAMGFFF